MAEFDKGNLEVDDVPKDITKYLVLCSYFVHGAILYLMILNSNV